MAQATAQRESVEDVLHWLKEAAGQKGYSQEFEATFDRADNKWLYFAIKLGGSGDAYDRAKVLQELEDSWDEHEPHSEWRLLLVPTAG